MKEQQLSTGENKPMVLMIDDSIELHRLVGARLRTENAEMVFSATGDEGLKIARERRPATILLDLDMPGTDGFAVLRELKAQPETSGIPIIVISGMTDAMDKVTAFELGANDYVTKPFDMAELKARLRATLRLDQLLRLLSDRAEVDGLTGLSNRASFNKHIARETAEAGRHGSPLTLAMLDIDHFKTINDTFGHPAGDEVIQRFAKVIQNACRSSDIPCRYGGEEFAVIMPQTSPQDAIVVAERIREAIAAVVWPRHPERRVTVSIGLTGFAVGQAPASPPEQLTEAADKALYVSKKGGRNRVTISETGTPVAKAA